MQRPIVTHQFLLRIPSEPATSDDLDIARDLQDTLLARRGVCAGMAANMICERKRIICFFDEDDELRTMLNPKIVERQGPYEVREGCLCLLGRRVAKRYQRIRVTWQDMSMNPHTSWFKGYVAEIIQHECDHLDGILI